MQGDYRKYVISVLLPDRVAILRDITSAIKEEEGNIVGISQTVIGSYFNVVLIALSPPASNPERLRASIVRNLPDKELSVVVTEHRPLADQRNKARGGARYVVTAAGKDRPGILKAITTFLAQRNINIEDWFLDVDTERATHIGDVTVPDQLDIKQLQDEFRAELAALGLQGGLQHENIFRATNEVGPIRSLLGGAEND